MDVEDIAGREALTGSHKLSATIKYKKYSKEADPLQGTKKLPSQTVSELANPPRHTYGWRPKPRIIELLNLADFTHQVQCQVSVDEPIFQPFPPDILFHGYQPFKSYEAKLYLRNNDLVPRRIKVVQPDTPFLTVKRSITPGKDEGSMIAAGMEVSFTVTFRPDSTEHYAYDLIVCTEREKFVVPIIAAGAAPALDLPDSIEFGASPARTEAKQTLFVRNVGSQASGFSMRAQPPFSVAPSQGYLAPGETLQLQLGFIPVGPQSYSGELEVHFESSDRSVYTQLRGQGTELDVGLSQEVVTLLPTYVTKTSQRSFKVVNRSSVVVSFSVHQHFSAGQDEAVRTQQTEELGDCTATFADADKDSTLSQGESEDEDTILGDASATARRHLKPLRQAALLDTQLFGSKSFQVLPAKGMVWPGSEIEVVVHFFPDFTREYEELAYVQIQGLQQRLPIILRGKGLGPAAVFSYDVLDVGLTYCNTPHQYEVELQNRGKIDVEFRLLAPLTPFGKKFSFEPDVGHLTSGEIQIIRVRLLSDLLGAFSETFEWSIKGSSAPLALQLKGYVAGPSFEVDVESLDFGVVSYGFRYTKELTISNTSEIPMRFSWRVPEDVSDTKEFQMVPQRGSILPGGKLKVGIDFVSLTVQRYAHNLVLDMPLVKDHAYTIRIHAECVVPKLTLSANVLSFGDCYLRYPYKQSLRLANDSKLPAKFEILAQDPQSKCLAIFSVEPSSGGIAAMADLELEVTLLAQTLGRLQIPVRVRVVGSRGGPLDLVIDAKCLGPSLLFGPLEARTSSASISFGRVAVLAEVFKPLLIHNPSPVPAEFKLFIEGRESLFSVEPRAMWLDPGESGEATVRAILDETVVFKDELHVLIEEGADLSVPLDASGVGSTLISEELAGDTLDFSHQFVGRPFSRDVTVHNMGRRTMTLVLNNERTDEIRKSAPKGTGKKFDITLLPADQQPVYSITPDRMVLEPKTSGVFVFNGLAHHRGPVSERMICMVTASNNAKHPRKAFDVAMIADISAPLLDFSERCLVFHHVYEKDTPIQVIKRPLTLRNISKLPMTFSLKAGAPFSIDCPSMVLQVDEAATVNIRLDPDFRADLQSAVVPQKLRVEYTDNPQRDSIDLVARLDYPNLAFESTKVEFGSVLSDTSRRVPVCITNSSAVDVAYRWAWEADSLQDEANSLASFVSKGGAKAAAKPTAELLFDVLPIKGALRPGESEIVTFSFFAFPGVRATATASCIVEGGPTYSVAMSGESNNIKFSVEPLAFDLGPQLFNKTLERDLVISNNGKVPYDFTISTSLLSRPGVVEPLPRAGVVGPGNKETVRLRICAGVPDLLLETLMVEIAHFDALAVTLSMDGVYPGISLGLPRIRDPLFDTCLENVRSAAAASAGHAGTPSRSGMEGLQLAPPGTVSRPGTSRAKERPSQLRTMKSTLLPGTIAQEQRRPDVEAERLRLVQLLLDHEAQQCPVPPVTPTDLIDEALRGPLDAFNSNNECGIDQDQAGARGPPVVPTPIAPISSARQVTIATTGSNLTASGANGLFATVAAKPALLTETALRDSFTPVKRNNRAIQPLLPSIYIANFLVDFGCVTKGTTLKRKFKLTNPGAQAVSLRFDKTLLEAWGFKIDPEGIAKLPERGEVDITLTLQANKSAVVQGPLELVLPLDVKGGPPVLLTLRAQVQVPDMRMSMEVLEYGSVQTGKAGVITLQLHNHKQVVCEWGVKKPVETSKSKDWTHFTLEPSEGTLEPDEKLNVRVVFTPVLGREAPYIQAFPIKINLNPKAHEILCRGRGVTPCVQFDPAGLVDCGPILPQFEGQEPSVARLKMVNPCSFPIEVVCLDLDQQYIADEDVLRTIDEKRFGEAGHMYLQPLQPGQALWPELVKEAQQKKKALAAKAVTAAAEDALGEASEAGEVGELDAVDATPAAASSKLVLVLHGPALSGTSTQATLLSERYNIPSVTFDELLLEAADLEAPDPTPAPHPVETPATEEGEDAASAGSLAANPLVPVPDSLFDAEISDLLYSKVLIDPDLEALPGFVASASKLPEPELLDLLERALKQALNSHGTLPKRATASSHFENGFVLDGLRSKYCTPAVVAKLLLLALGMQPVLTEAPAVMPVAPPTKAGKKGAASSIPDPPPAAPIYPEAWTGPHDVHFLTLAAPPDLVRERFKAKRQVLEEQRAAQAAKARRAAEAAIAETAAALTVAEGTAAAAGEAVTAESAAMTASLLSLSKQPYTPPGSSRRNITTTPTAVAESASEEDPDVPSPGPTPEEQAAKAAEEAAAAEALLVAEVDAATQAFALEQVAVAELLGATPSAPLGKNRAVQRGFNAAAGSPEAVMGEACGITFRLGKISAALPQLPEDALIIPDPYEMQVVHKPRTRTTRNAITKFKLLTLRPPTAAEIATALAAEAEAEAALALAAAPKAKGGGGKAAAAGTAAAAAAALASRPSTPPLPALGFYEQGRWVIPANGSIDLAVHFQSPDLGKFTSSMAFEVLGGERGNSVVMTGTCGLPQIATDYRNVFYKKVKVRPSTPTIARQFIISKNVFEFGPLLLNKDSRGYLEGLHPENTSKLRVTNNGLFDLHVDFSLKSKEVVEQVGEPASKKKAPPLDKKKAAALTAGGLDTVFVFSPTSLDLKVDETQELTIYAFPVAEGSVEDVLLCKIQDNPVPVEFQMAVIGARPVVLAYLDDGSPPPTLQPTLTPGEKPPPAQPNKLLSEGVQFGRLLVNKHDSRSFVIDNPGLLPIKWRLAGVDALPKELTVSHVSGDLLARNSVKVVVEFDAVEKRDVIGKLVLEVLDKAEMQGVASSTPIAIKGEAYKIERDIRFPQEGLNGVDFGLMRVADTASKPIVIKNTGKYQISFNFKVKGAAKDVFSVVPDTGHVEPGKDLTVQVCFNREQALQRELHLVGNSDIVLSIIEPLTNHQEEVLPINVSVQAVFSKYQITPQRGINFGPVTYNTSSKPKTFEIANTGEFAFDFKLMKIEDSAATPNTVPSGKTTPEVVLKKGTAAGGQISISQFTFEPAAGRIEPGARTEVSVVFKAEGSAAFNEKLGIDISERDYNNSPNGIEYDVSGESCIPGMDAANIEAIFEEHVVSASLDQAAMTKNEFGLRERVFNFGTIVADLAAALSAVDAAAGSAATGLADGGVRANLKIINPIKVPCTVNFSVKPRGQYPLGVPFPMEVDPPQLVIPPHEFRYMAVVFRPRAIQQYSATFEAMVQDGTDAATRSFSCEMRGEGMLPSLALQEPSLFDASGRPLLKFGRLLVGRSQCLRINLKNNGTMPAGARLEAAPSEHFRLLEGPQAFTVESKKAQTFTIEFRPLVAGLLQYEVHIKVQRNPFEDYRIAIAGEAYQEDVSFDGLPDNAMDELRLADCPVNKAHSIAFVIRNTSPNKAFRFRWPAAPSAPAAAAAATAATPPSLIFSPSVGHILPGGSKDVTVTFYAAAPVKLLPQEIKMNIVQIQRKEGALAVEWDDRSVVLDYESEAAQGGGQPTARPEPEPAVTDVAGSTKDLSLKVFAVADNARFECDNKPVLFRPTMMFQTRSFTFPLKNTSGARMDFKFWVAAADGILPDTSSMYTVSPEGGVIEAGASTDITVKFAPMEVDDCARLLVCDIPNLEASVEPLARQLNGKVLRPWCHFDLPESDYISGGRRNAEMPGPSGAVGPLDPATRVLEMESLGIRVRNTKRFMVLNPTAIGYEFSWDPVNQAPGAPPSPFSCLTKRGTVTGGRHFEMVFEYTPVNDSVAEAFWLFRIPEKGIEVPFLLAGLVSEPRVFFDMPSINFGQVLIGGARGHATVTIINGEHLPFEFSLDRNSYDATAELIASTGQKPVVQFEPSSGTIPPNSSIVLRATFAPLLEKSVNHNVVCNVKKKPTRLALNVKGEGYAIHETLNIESADGSVVTLAPRQTNNIDFGQVIINERCVRAVVLVNSGTLNYDFVWDMGTNPRVEIKPESGTVPKGERLVCELAYHPHAPDRMHDCKVSCQVINGNKYSLALNGVGHKPRLDLSFQHADFGAVTVFQQGMTPTTKVLLLRNNDTLPVSVNPQWTNTDEWQMEMTPGVMQPGESRQALITLKPAAPAPYSARLAFEVNGLYTLHVDLKGEGAHMRLEVADPAKRMVIFGGVQRFQSCTRVVQIVNRGRTTLSFRSKPSLEALRRLNIDVQPAGEVLLRPRETAELTFFFRPQARMRSFAEEFVVDVSGVEVPLLTLTGACLGTELRLASDSLPFGPVVLGARSVKRLALENTGDVGTKFTWDKRALGENFSVFPAEGFLGPHQDVKLDVTFHPAAIGSDLRADRVKLTVNGGEDRVLTLTGSCIGTSAQPDAVNFNCAVRASASQSIQLHNTSSSGWNLRPAIRNEFFSGAELVEVPPGAKVSYPVTFRPLAMSTPEQPHEGSAFFPIPDGTGLLYRLVGRAERPVPEGSVERVLTAKLGHVEVLKVSNWLHKPQRFRVVIDRKQVDKSTLLEGPEYVDVPALSSKDYKLAVHCSTTNPTTANVTFKNEDSGEYCFYELKYTAGPPPLRGSLALESPVRTSTSTKVSVRNTLDSDVVMTSSCTNKLVSVPAKVTVPANSVMHVEVGYRPLLVSESEAVLKLESAELGLFEWSLKLAGLLTNPERTLAYNVPLGSRETQVFRFMHWLDEKADYKCGFKTEKGSAFECAAMVSAPPAAAGGFEVLIEVHFEPTSMGESIRDTLIVSSATGGEYHCPLVGRCVAPKPQGPIECGKGSGVVAFKNVFLQDAEFQYSIDNPAFSVSKPSEKISTKKSTNINVSFKPDAAKGLTQRTGKLTIACPLQTTSPWVFYLQASETEAGKK